MAVKQYRLLKDLPDLKAGAIFTKNEYNDSYVSDEDMIFPVGTIVGNPDWFEKMHIEEPQEKYTITALHAVYRAIEPVFDEWCKETNYITGSWNDGRTDIEPEMQDEYWTFQRKSAWKQFTTLLDKRLAGSSIEDKLEHAYSLKELYQFVTAYAKEANDEGFNMSVGDFVDWIAAQDQDDDEFEEDELDDYVPPRSSEVVEKSSNEQAKPVLPEKLEERNYQPPFISNEEGIIAETYRIKRAVNAIIDYLSRKEQ